MANPWDNDSTPDKPKFVPPAEDERADDAVMKKGNPWDDSSISDTKGKSTSDGPILTKNETTVYDRFKNRNAEAWTTAKIAGKGVPILGNYIPEDQEMKDYQEQNPITSGGLKFGGGMAATIPLGMGVGGLMAKATPYIASQLPKLWPIVPQMLGYGATGAGLGAGDAATNPDSQPGDIKKGAISGGAWGMAGPLVSKLLSPKMPGPGPAPKMPSTSPYMDPAHRMGPLGKETDEFLARVTKSASEKAKEAMKNKPLPWWADTDNVKMMASGVLGGASLFGGAGIPLSAAISSLPYSIPAAIKGARAIPHMAWANKAIGATKLTTNDIIKALALQQAGTPIPSEPQ